MNTFKSVTAITLASVIALTTTSTIANERTKGKGATGIPVIYVTSQNLYYDTLLLKDLPYNGTNNFQLLEFNGPEPFGIQTEFGPTDTGYYGGRWWVDDGNGVMDENDHYFLCPLLGPGRSTP